MTKQLQIKKAKTISSSRAPPDPGSGDDMKKISFARKPPPATAKSAHTAKKTSHAGKSSLGVLAEGRPTAEPKQLPKSPPVAPTPKSAPPDGSVLDTRSQQNCFNCAVANEFADAQVPLRKSGEGIECKQESMFSCSREKWKIISLTAVVLVWMFLGMIILCTLEDIEWVTAAYILAQIITTIGYGDVSVHDDSDAMKFFLSLYSLSAIIGVSWIITGACEALMDASQGQLDNRLAMLAGPKTPEQVVGKPETSVMMRRNTEELRNAEMKGDRGKSVVLKPKFSQKQIRRYNEDRVKRRRSMSLLFNGAYVIVFLLMGMIFFGAVESCTCSYGKTLVEGCDPDNCEETGGYVKSYMDAWYMSCISLTTIGFGDFAPKSEGGRAFAVVWMIAGIVVVSHFTLQTSKIFLKRSMSEKLLHKNLDLIFDTIDRDHSGELSRHEFFLFALMEFGLINEDEIEQLNQTFDDLDIDKSDTVSREEIKKRFGKMREMERDENTFGVSVSVQQLAEATHAQGFVRRMTGGFSGDGGRV